MALKKDERLAADVRMVVDIEEKSDKLDLGVPGTNIPIGKLPLHSDTLNELRDAGIKTLTDLVKRNREQLETEILPMTPDRVTFIEVWLKEHYGQSLAKPFAGKSVGELFERPSFIHTSLLQAGIWTVPHLTAKTAKEIKSILGGDSHRLAKVRFALGKLGLGLKGDPTGPLDLDTFLHRGVSRHVLDATKRLGINTLNDLATCSEALVKGLDHMTPTMLRYIKRQMADRGLKFAAKEGLKTDPPVAARPACVDNPPPLAAKPNRHFQLSATFLNGWNLTVEEISGSLFAKLEHPSMVVERREPFKSLLDAVQWAMSMIQYEEKSAGGRGVTTCVSSYSVSSI